MNRGNRREAIGNSKKVQVCVFALCALLFAPSFPAEAQQLKKVPRIGYLSVTVSGPDHRLEAFRQGLRELGYVDGQNIAVEYRYAEEQEDRLPKLVAELIDLKTDIIVTNGTRATRAAKSATKTIPIVMAYDLDPIGSGYVASLARPGGNITGLTNISPDLSGKRLEVLKEALPGISV